ncbi:MAG: PAS domain S-box protein, partial [Pseudolabrys sp.]
MNEFQFTCLTDPRLAAHALSPAPVWLWSADGTRVLWANPTAAAIFDAASPAAVADIRFEPTHTAAVQVARLAGTLPQGAAPRLERLRGFGAGFGSALICLCSRIILADNSSAVLAVSTERAAKDLSLPERARRLMSDFKRPAAIFTADGELIEATAEALERFRDKRDLIALGAEQLAREAMLNGLSEGNITTGSITMVRLGASATVTLLLAYYTAEQIAQAAPPTVAAPVTRAQTHRHPFRFIWQMDAANRFTRGAEEFAKIIGPQAAAVLDRPWAEIAAALKLDSQGQLANALASHGTWSGIVVPWPADDAKEPLPIEMSGLPVFDRDRQFAGYRGFSICRDADRLAALEQRRAQPANNVLAFTAPAEAPPALSPVEASAFQELGRALSDRLKKTAASSNGAQARDDFAEPAVAPPRAARNGDAARDLHEGRPILDRLPVGLLVYRLNTLVYANRAFLDWTGYPTLDALTEAGGLDSLFIETKGEAATGAAKNGGKTLTISTVNGQQKPVDGRLFSVAWNGENALVLMISTLAAAAEDHGKVVPLRRLESENSELKSILDTATDGVVVLDRAGRVLSANRSAEALFGYEAAELAALSFGDLFAPESRRSVLDYLDRIARAAGMLDTGREAIGLVKQGGLVPLYFTMGRIADGEKICAVMRDITAWKRTEEELINARQQAEKASTAKSEVLAKISHEIRTP